MSKGNYLNEQEKAFGARIREIRIAQGFNTQYEFVKVFTGSTKRSSFISRVEKGTNLDFTTIVRLTRALKISMRCLFDFNNNFSITKINHDVSLEKSISGELRKLGMRVRDLRKSKGLIQLDLALESLMGDTSISLYERGELKPEFDTIVSIALGLKVEAWELFDHAEDYSEFS
jgi:transcriptional regulator with XRE-family HTH domain